MCVFFFFFPKLLFKYSFKKKMLLGKKIKKKTHLFFWGTFGSFIMAHTSLWKVKLKTASFCLQKYHPKLLAKDYLKSFLNVLVMNYFLSSETFGWRVRMGMDIFQTQWQVQDHSTSAKKSAYFILLWNWNPSRDFSQLHSQHLSKVKSVPCFPSIS